MRDRFDLEEQITNTHNFAHNMSVLSKRILEDNLSHDQISTALDGLSILLNLHADEMFDTFVDCFDLATDDSLD